MSGETLQFPQRPTQRLESWKAIASYLKRDVTTVQRWEKREGLPVHRHMHGKLGSVYAFTSELDDWAKNRSAPPEPDEKKKLLKRRPWIVGAAVAGLALVLAVLTYRSFWSSPVTPTAHRVWTGPDVERLGWVSLDGRHLSFTNPATGDASVYDIATGKQWAVTGGRSRERWEYAHSPAISPDGNRIAYVWFNREFSPELRLAGVHGENDRLLFRDAGILALEVYAWSPDGREMAVACTRENRMNQLLLVRAQDGAVRLLKQFGVRYPTSAAFSPDGRYLAYDLQAREDPDEHDLFILPVDAGEGGAPQTQLAEDSSDDFLLGWDPHGRGVLFGSDRSGAVDAWFIKVRDGKPDGTPQLVSKNIGRVAPAGVTRDGALYYGVRLGVSDVYIADLDPATLAPREPVRLSRLIGSNRAPEWSPDGRNLACVSVSVPGARRPSPRIIVRSMETGQHRELWPDLGQVHSLRWASGGKQFLATGCDRHGRQGLFQIDPVGGGVMPIAIEEQSTRLHYVDLACTPDSARVLFKLRKVYAEPSPLVIYDFKSRTRTQLLPSAYRFALSPDGRELAWSDYAGERQQAISIVPATGGPARELCRVPGQVTALAWTADGGHLLFFRRDELWKAPVRGGKPERLAAIMPNLRDLRVHPSGRRIAFTGGEAKSEVWVMKNFLPR